MIHTETEIQGKAGIQNVSVEEETGDDRTLNLVKRTNTGDGC